MTQNARMTVTTAVACVLASTVLFSLFISSLWFVIGVGAVLAVAGAGALTRLRTLPVLACAAGSLAGLVLYLNLVFEAGYSWLLVIPTSGSLSRLWHLAGTGVHDANRYAPPAPNLPGLLLLAAGGVGITALLADLIAVRLRATALAGLPLLVLFTVPVTMDASHGQFATSVAFCLAGIGYLAMLSADGRERIRVWGRLVSLWRQAPRHDPAHDDGSSGGRSRIKRPGPDTKMLAAAGRRVGLASIVLALCAPVIVPGLHPSKLFSSGPGIGGRGGSGGQSLALPNALSQAVTQLHEPAPRTVFTYTTSASASMQASNAQYFRQYVSDTLGGSGWQVDNYAANSVPVSALPDPEGLTDATVAQTVITRVTVRRDFPSSGAQPTFLPLPYPAIEVRAPGNWLANPDRMVYSRSDSIAGRTYSVTSVAVNPTPAQLSVVPDLVQTPALAPDLRLPESYRTTTLRRLATSHAAGQATEFGKVNALATWLSGPDFTYTLAASPLSSPANLTSFLTKGKSGYCVQYAYAMTVLARLLGIPARFAIGYTAGTRLRNGTYEVRNIDAHAWTEVYFPSLGWIRFEPTPAGQGTASAPGYMNAGAGRGVPGLDPVARPTQAPNSLRSPAPNPGAGRNIQPDITGQAAATGGRAGTPWTAVALAVVAALVMASALIAIVAPPAQRAMAGHPDFARRRPRTATAGVVAVAGAALVALALYRLMSRTAGLNLGVGWATVGIAFGATAAVALIAPAVFRLTLRRWRWMRAGDDATRAHAAWREFHDDLADFGVTSRPSEPPRTLAARVTTTMAEPAAAAVTRLALAEERASYAARPGGSEHLRRDGITARRGLSAGARPTTRWRAAVLPASMMTAIAEAAARIPDRLAAFRARRRRRSLHPAVALLPPAPPLFHPLHHPGPPGLPRTARRLSLLLGLGARGLGRADPGQVPPPADHGPDQRQHRDHRAGRLQVHPVGDHARRDQARTKDDARHGLR
jgi:transglutaminase-like putative cysteine protease